MKTVALAWLVLSALGVAPAFAASRWIELRSTHFVVVGEVGERELRQIAEGLESFREALSRALPNATVATPVPTTIIVFASDRSFAPYKLQVGGRPMDRLGGFFQAGEDANYIALSFEWGARAYPIVFHEYTHALVNATVQSVPTWLNEGLAEVYSTFQARNGGRTAVIGLAHADHLDQLRDAKLMPLDDLLAVTNDSPEYNEGTRRGVLYAESWALTHYLLFGSEQRREQLPGYLTLLEEGMPLSEAFRKAFATEPRTLEAELRAYLKRFVIDGVTMTFDRPFTPDGDVHARAISEADAQAYTAELLTRQLRNDAAFAQIQGALKAEPDSARALAALGRFYLRANRLDEALPLLERAASLMPDDAAIAGTYARAVVETIRRFGPLTPDEASVVRARAALAHAAALQDEDAYVTAMQGYIEMIDGKDLDAARRYLERAVVRAPTREEYQLLLAQIALEQQDLARGRSLLAPLAARGSRPEIRRSAREMLDRAAPEAEPSDPVSPR